MTHKRSKFLMHACVCSNQCYIKGRLVCRSSCHSCPALHCRTGPVAPRDNHSLVGRHQFSPNITSNHLAIFESIPLLHVCASPRLVYGNTRQECACCIRRNKNLYVYTLLCESLLNSSILDSPMFLEACLESLRLLFNVRFVISLLLRDILL